MAYFVYSEAGHDHRNEDVVKVRTVAGGGKLFLCALADGQGGQRGGAEAARIAVQTCLETANALPSADLLEERTWKQTVRAADEAVADTPVAGYTTLVTLCIDSRKVVGASCGDSAALLLQQEKTTLLTDCQVKDPPVGSRFAYPVAFSAELGTDWKLLVMSDGVWKYVGWDKLMTLMQQQAGEELMASLRETVASNWGGKLPDDFSLALFH